VFSTGVVPLVISVTLAALGEQGLYRFGLVRVWGTVGFLVVVVLFPPALHRGQQMLGLAAAPPGASEPGLAAMFLAAAVLMLAAALVALSLPGDAVEAGPSARGADWRELRRHPPFVRALLFSFTAYLFLQGPMSLFPIYLRARGGGLDALSHMWILMVTPEIPLIALSGAGVRRIGARGLLAGGVAAGAARWLVCGLTADPRAIYAVQCLHGVAVAGLGIGASLYVESTVPSRLRSTGQGLNAMAGGGVGAIFSNVAAGWLIDHGGAEAPFLVGGACGLVLAALAPLLLPSPSRPPSG
jgi:PPP family 3-phenylpropionic acid transporter